MHLRGRPLALSARAYDEFMSKPKPCVETSALAHKAVIAREARRVTSYDVAQVAGVSQSAVSRCFQAGASVSEATLTRVMKAAALLDYIPNAAARSLITRRSNMVAVIISRRDSLHSPQLLAELSQQIGARGKRVLLFMLNHETDEDIDRVLGEVWQYQVDGVIAAAGLSPAHRAECARRRMPLVLFNRSAGEAGMSSWASEGTGAGTGAGRGAESACMGDVNTVSCDQREAGRLLVSRLAAAGHRRFAFIAAADDTRVVHERRHGACARLVELGLPAPTLTAGQSDYQGGKDGLRAIVATLGGVPDAVLCGSDGLAIGCLDHARHALGLDVPQQLSVAALDAGEPVSWLAYDLTTLRQPVARMAQAAAELLCALIDRHGTGEGAGAAPRVFGAQLVEGATARLTPVLRPAPPMTCPAGHHAPPTAPAPGMGLAAVAL